jgi:apolipoprotein D and lipocalin family protein
MLRTLLAGAVALLILAGCASEPPNTNPLKDAPLKLAPAVDLDRYMGRWYVIANIPYFAERNFVGSYIDFSLRPDGRIDDVFHGFKGGFSAGRSDFALLDTVVPNTNNALWRASPFWPISFANPILYVDPEYRFALIGYPDKSKGWIFSRGARIDDASYDRFMKMFAAQGYDTSRFLKVPQYPEQLDQPGFQTPEK